jgi:hypothetical protein
MRTILVRRFEGVLEGPLFEVTIVVMKEDMKVMAVQLWSGVHA